ncbi:XrtA/PEP-CTERM system TPR-repeat protein PrsT [Methyloversatilis sp.]|uniref:XrtA/PEP-CTERM system TPR-repeat protein PrsT n=1 Tax=Methyloversatilis sp. TaxID=2569862 RepID=UPI002736E58A|nr:XrtA/PEP-CTERM system TPR-repeat protein PrsT [Methyloversatilis sp.]MDP2869311.1 PEP-CTERM system TPR-repeat protein PrsT [Methyloversatilis sp.]MDP3456896.1 PEP-CTERM system TPR-repeat protein PrsT [Methyloversatilis sp.]MDP3580094.1 PEP-CTERM system TPR-repeat protein PrsT [Methyloversatilis sp.]
MKRSHWSLIAIILFAGVLASFSARAADEAGRYYEDALLRYERKDDAGAIIQLKNALKADPGMLAAHLLMGRAGLRKGDFAAAEVALREAQRRGASRAEYIVPLANVLLAIGQQKELLETLQPTDLPPGIRYDLLLLRARAHQESSQYAQAIAVINEARALNPNAPSALALHARFALGAGRAEEAATLAEQATGLGPADTDAWTARAAVAYASGNLAVALEYYDQALKFAADNSEALLGRSSVMMDLGRMAEAKVSLLQLAKVDKTEPRAAYLRAVIADLEGDRDGARKLLGEVVNIIDPLPRGALTSRSHLALIAGLAHLSLGGPAKAKEYFELHVRFFPSQPAARKPLASLQIAGGDPASGIVTLEPLMRSGTRDPEVLSLMATAYGKLKRHERATELLEQASRLGKSPEIQTSLGLSLLGSKQTQEGLAQLREVVKDDPGQGRASMALALTALREQQPRRAAELMEEVIKREPDNLPALNVLGVARAAAGDFAGARKAYDKALSKDKNFDSVKLNLVKLELAEGKPAEARTRLLALLKEKPDHPSALFELAQLDVREKRTAEALRGLEILRDKHRRHVDGQIALIELYLQTGALDKALEVAKDSSPSQPGYLAVQAALVRVQLARSDAAGARATLTSMTRAADFDAVAQYRIARLQMQAGNPSGAAYSLEKALQGAPDFVPAKVMQGELLLGEGALDKADARAQQLLRAAKPPPEAFKLAGDVAFARSRWAEAIDHYGVALSKGAGVDVAGRLYETHRRAGNASQARASVEALVKSRPRDMAMKLLLSQAQTDAGHLREAKATLETVLKAGESAPVLNNLANLQWQLKDPAAQQTAERAFKLAPGDALILDTLGWILVQKAQLDAGLRHLREARLRDPANPEIRYHLAWALAKSGRKGEAFQELEAALQSGRSFPGIDSARSLRAELGAD